MTGTDRIPTNLRTLMLLETLAHEGRAMTATELGQHIGLAKQTSHRLCATLESEGFLIREGTSKRFLPARRSRVMSNGLLFASSRHIARYQVLQAIAREVRETVNFVVPEAGGMSYLDRIETDWPFRVQLPIGSNVPFHCTASGKTFMASLPPKARRTFVESLTLERQTRHTFTDPEALLAELADVARQGYALDREEFVDGMVAIAVPVRDPDGRFAAALAFHGPAQRIDIENAVARRDVLMRGAEQLARALFLDTEPVPA